MTNFLGQYLTPEQLTRALNVSSACMTHGDTYISKGCYGCDVRLQSILDALKDDGR